MEKKFFQLLCAACSLTVLLNAIEPYESVRTVDYEGYILQESYILYDKVLSQETTIFIDVGSEDGGAARFIAANTNDSVKIYNVNPWSENEYDFQKFLSNVIQENQSEHIVPIRMTSKEASAVLNLTSECIYIDSSDAATVYDNILAWSSHLAPGGVIVGNHWEWATVELPVVQAAVDLNLVLTINGTYWFLKSL